ncbi:MAG TPA: signal peptidase I [Nocardioides sp.]|nr:signal peptidase I [Nocardioides sp.]
MRTVWSFLTQVFSWALLGLVVAGALALIVVPKATGSRPLTVLSGSMVPTYDPGDVVIVRPTDAEELQVGDVITFQPVSGDPRLTTHRIDAIAYGNEGQEYVTKGDANDSVDLAPVAPDQVRGEVWYAVPLVGHVSVWMASGWLGTVVDGAAVCLLLYGGYFVLAGLRERRRAEAPA